MNKIAPLKARQEEAYMVPATTFTATVAGILALAVTVVHAAVWGVWGLFGG